MAIATHLTSVVSFSSFGDLLKYLRRRARLTQLDLSIAVGYSEAQISRLEKNQRLPDLTALKALFIPALQLEQEPELATRLLTLAETARQEDAPTPGFAPYKGLLFFDEQDADWFFGRESLTAHLVERVNEVTQRHPRLLAIVGASGSGKSSVVRAGLSVALKRTGWEINVLAPTAQPLHAFTAMTQRPSSSRASHRGLIVDQFEEVFTLCRDESARAEFIERLMALANQPDESTTLVIVLRADFYSHCAQYPELRQAIAAQQEYIGPMTREELRSAVEEPARRGNWEFEPGLVELMLSEVGVGHVQDQEPGALPLLSHALLATWERRCGRTFTLEGYRAVGGVRGAIAETAESVFTDQLNQPQQQLAREVFLRLTELGEGTEDTRRRAALTELVPRPEAAAQLRAVLNILADARLVSLGEDDAEVAHEALIREWQRLREWLNEDREGLRLHRHLTEDAHEWEKLARDSDALYRGARLAQLNEWAAVHPEEINETEGAFLAASNEQEREEEAAREVQRQRELAVAKQMAETAQKLADTETQRAEEQTLAAARLRQRAFALGGAFLLAVVLAFIALFFGDQARTSAGNAQANAQAASVARADALVQQRLATSRELAAAATSNLSVDPERSILLALQAVNVTYSVDQTWTREAEEALHRAVQASRIELTLSGHTDSVISAAFSPDGTRIATASVDKSAKIWDAATGKALLTLLGHQAEVNTATYSSDGKRIVTSSDDHTAKTWDAVSGKEILTLEGHTAEVSSALFSPDGKRLATASLDKTVKLWDAATGAEQLTLTGPTDGVRSIAISPDGTRLAAASLDGTAYVWDTRTGKELIRLSGHTDGVLGIAWSPDGKRLATASTDDTAKVWDAVTGAQLVSFTNHTDPVQGVAFSPDSERVATASYDGTARVWDAETGKELFALLGHDKALFGIGFSPDGQRLVTASDDHTVRVWDAGPSRELAVFSGHGDSVFDVAFSPDGKRLATASFDKTAKVWDGISGEQLFTLSGHAGQVLAIAYSPDGKRLATASTDLTAKVWDANTGQEQLTLTGHSPGPGKGPFSGLLDVRFSPDGTRIATAGADGSARIWDAGTGKLLRTLNGTVRLNAVAFSPDGTRLATGSDEDDNKARLWDLSTGLVLQTFAGHTDRVWAVAFSPDGEQLATGSTDATVAIWSLRTGERLVTLRGHTTTVIGLAYAPDGKYLATAAGDRTIRLWDPTTGKELLTLASTDVSFGRIAISPNGARLAAASGDGNAREFILGLTDLVALARTRVTRSLTASECQEFLHVEQCPPSP